MEIDVVNNLLTYEYKWVLAYDSKWREDRAWRLNKLTAEGWRVVSGITQGAYDGILVLVERQT